MNIVIIIHLLIIALEIRGLWLSYQNRKWKILYYYTQLSNLVTLFSSVLLIIFRDAEWVVQLRYLSSCMLTMTFLITIFVLIPLGGSPQNLLFSGSGLYHHVLCPILSVLCYIILENHAPFAAISVPVILTLIYGITMFYLNYRRKVDGPYPFFRVHKQSVKASVIWFFVLLAVITLISALVGWLAA